MLITPPWKTGRFLCAFLYNKNTDRQAYVSSAIPGDKPGIFHLHCKGISMPSKQLIRLSLPSKGRLELDSLGFLAAAGLRVFKPNPRQYEAAVPAFPDLSVIFQRPGDIVVSVRQGSVDFGITGLDVIEE